VTNIHITNVHIYNKTVINNVTVNRVSYNGGHGGIMARPRPEEERAFRERHFEATRVQMDHEHSARGNREFLASVNHGRPNIAATSRPGDFHGHDRVAARPESSFRPDNRRDNRAMDRGIPRPENSARNIDRPMPHQDVYHGGNPHQDSYNRGGRPENNAPRPDTRMENHGGQGPRPTAYHPQNGGAHEGAPHGEQARGDQGAHGHEHGR
jgi:hypothetical protein